MFHIMIMCNILVYFLVWQILNNWIIIISLSSIVASGHVTLVPLCAVVIVFCINCRNALWEHTKMLLDLLNLYAFHALGVNSLIVLYTQMFEVILSIVFGVSYC
jgi:uncharacterized membrane protein YeiH